MSQDPTSIAEASLKGESRRRAEKAQHALRAEPEMLLTDLLVTLDTDLETKPR